MIPEKFRNFALILVFLAVGSIAWRLQLRPTLVLDPSSLSSIPRQILGWQSRDIPLKGQVEAMLDADFNLQRVYSNPLGDLIWLYIGYYGTERGGKPEHTPDICYDAQGWQRTHEQVLEISGVHGLRANEYIVEKQGERHLVLFWYKSSRGTGILRTRALTLDHLINRLSDGRADGALVRVSTPIVRGKEVEARSRLLSFAEVVDPLITQNWPNESEENHHSER